MPKARNKDFDVKEYFKKLAEDAGIPPEHQEGILTALENEKFGRSVRDGVLARSDYSRAMDELTEQQSQFEQQKQRWTEWYEKDAKPWVTEAQKRLQAYESRFGAIEDLQQTSDPNVVKTPSGDFLRKSDIEQMLQSNNQGMAAGAAGLVKGVTTVALKHARMFNEELDLNELENFMAKNKIQDIQSGWEAMNKDRLDELKEKELDAIVNKRVEAKLREAKSKHDFPDDPRPDTKIPVFDYDPEPKKAPAQSRNSRYQSFVEALEKNKDLADQPDPL